MGSIQQTLASFGGGATIDPDAAAFLTATGIVDPTITSAIDTLCIDLKAASLWTPMFAVYPFVGGTATAHKFNLKDPQDTNGAFRIAWGGTVTHAAAGITGNGTTGFGDTFLAPSTTIPANEGSLGVYVSTNASLSCIEIGAETAGAQQLSIATNVGTEYYVAASGGQNSGVAGAAGFHQVSRVDASNQIYKVANGAASSGASAYNAPTRTVYLCARNDGYAAWTSSRTISFAYIGRSLTSGELTSFYVAVQAFQTTLGRNV